MYLLYVTATALLLSLPVLSQSMMMPGFRFWRYKTRQALISLPSSLYDKFARFAHYFARSCSYRIRN